MARIKVLKSKCTRQLQCRSTFGSWVFEKAHAVVARSIKRSASDFWKLWCWKSARRCGAKHISKSKCKKKHSVGKLLEEELFKKCTPLWREARFEVKMCKAHHVRNTCGVEMLKKCTLLWRETHFEVKSAQNWRSRTTSGRWDIGKVHASTTTTTTATTLHDTTLQLQLSTTNHSSLQLTTINYK